MELCKGSRSVCGAISATRKRCAGTKPSWVIYRAHMLPLRPALAGKPYETINCPARLGRNADISKTGLCPCISKSLSRTSTAGDVRALNPKLADTISSVQVCYPPRRHPRKSAAVHYPSHLDIQQ